MSRYIDADALKKEIKQDIADNGLTERYVFYRINEAPTIDIVRCKECKFSARYVDDGHIECRLYSHPLRHDYHEMKADDFCSYGEREGE